MLALCVAGTAGWALAATLPTQEEALRLAFPGAQLTREQVFLSEAERDRAAKLSREEVRGRLLTRWVARRDGAVAGTAYLDVHVVRTLPETMFVALGPDGKVLRVEVVAFGEPPEYRAPERWVDQLEGRRLDDELAVKRGIRPLSGATLTARAMTGAARRVLALHRVIQEREASAPARPQ